MWTLLAVSAVASFVFGVFAIMLNLGADFQPWADEEHTQSGN
jgi:hypothetical protein